MKEITELRKEREKHFLCDDGSIKAYFYNEDINFLKDGKYRSIDNTIIETDEYFENKENNFKVSFHKKSPNIIYELKSTNYFLECSLLQNKNPQMSFEPSYNCLNIANILDGVDIKYDIVGSKLKESIILKKNIEEDISFKIVTDVDLILKQNKIFGVVNGKVLYHMDSPFMVANDKKTSANVKYALAKKEDYYVLTMKLDHAWLAMAEYPVIIDPTLDTDSFIVGSTFIYQGDTGVQTAQYDYLKVGVENDVINRILLRPGAMHIDPKAHIISAELALYAHADYEFPSTGNPKLVAHEVTEDWHWLDVAYDWNKMHDKFREEIVGTVVLTPAEVKTEGNTVTKTLKPSFMNITEIVKKWIKGAPNYGIMLRVLDEDNLKMGPYYIYSHHNTLQYEIGKNPDPDFIVNYRLNDGKIGHMSYKEYDLKNSSSQVNVNNGNVVNIYNLNETIGSKLPVSLQLISNTQAMDYASGFLSGWKFNYDERLKPVKIVSKDYLYYVDSTGKIGYPYSVEENTYKDEDGRNLTFVKEGNSYKETDKYGNIKYFSFSNGDEYLLTKIVDIDKNEINITHDSTGKIAKITDSSGKEINITYTSTGLTITGPTYNSTVSIVDDKLSSIIRKTDKTTFVYNGDKVVTKIADENGLSFEFDYYTVQNGNYTTYKLSKITEKGIDGTLGRTNTYVYNTNSTIITDDKDIETKYVFNVEGSTIGITENKKGALLADTYGTTRKYFENDSSNKSNKIETSTIINRFTSNHIPNPSFESLDVSTVFGSAGIVNGNARSGKYCFKGQGNERVEGLVHNIFANNRGITFSGYIKNSALVTMNFSVTGPNKTDPLGSIPIPPSEEYQRFSFTTSGWLDGTLLNIVVNSEEDYYIDDLQLDYNNTLNGYNLFDNCDYQNIDLTTWSNTSNCHVVQINDREKALKIVGNPLGTVTANRRILVSSKKGDIYNLSFWYKNNGVEPSITEENPSKTKVIVSYFDDENDAKRIPINLEYNKDEWLFFSKSFVIDKDSETIQIDFELPSQVNELYITNVMLVKDIGEESYDYDEEGNLVSAKNLKNDENTLKYDSTNKLIASFTPKGSHYSYEYANDNSSKILKGISPTGISNEIEYDSFGNPIRTIINNVNPDNELKTNSDYYIRTKGTKKYLHYDFETKKITEKECNCNHQKFTVIKNGEYYTFSLFDRYVSYDGSKAVLILVESDYTLFKITRRDNGSYAICPKLYPNLNLAIVNGELSILEKNDDDYRQQFYFEDVTTNNFIESKATYTEDGRFLTSTTDTLGKKTVYDVDTDKGLVKSITDPRNIVTSYQYNDKDQVKSVTNENKAISIENMTNNSSLNIVFDKIAGNKVTLYSSREVTLTDESIAWSSLGTKVNSGPHADMTQYSGLLLTDEVENGTLSATDSDGNTTTVNYSISKDDKTISYEYDISDRLSKISTGQKNYTFEYDEWNKPTTVKINGNTLITNEYEANNGNLLTSTYGNGDTITYTYDDFGRVQETQTTFDKYKYFYNNLNQLEKIEYGLTKQLYYYDLANRLKQHVFDTFLGRFEINYDYDKDDNLVEKTFKKYNDLTLTNKVTCDSLKMKYEYDKDDSLIKLSFDNKDINYNYDYLGRLVNTNIAGNFNVEYKYYSQGEKTSLIVQSIKIENDTYEYKYDELYNIIDIFLNKNITNHYKYDNFNQLIEDDNYVTNIKYKYSYDKEGNILKKEEYDPDTDTLIKTDTFEYTNSEWEDQLTKYNDEAITYDAIGNPLTIGSKTLTWENGRQLHSYSDSNASMTIFYEYNADGIRTSKYGYGESTNYFLEGSDIVLETRGTDMLYYIRNNTGALIGFKYNGEPYYYIKNLQEDIIGLKDSNFDTIATYTYDAWGKLLSIKDATGVEITDENHIAHINPFRYRSYYYDKETGLYYLNNRYYSPTLVRFINPDKNICEQNILSGNLYLYTENNPSSRIDENGENWFLIAAMVGGLISLWNQVNSNNAAGTAFYEGTTSAFLKGSTGALIGIIAEDDVILGTIGSSALNVFIDMHSGKTFSETVNNLATDTMLNIAGTTLPSYDFQSHPLGNIITNSSPSVLSRPASVPNKIREILPTNKISPPLNNATTERIKRGYTWYDLPDIPISTKSKTSKYEFPTGKLFFFFL